MKVDHDTISVLIVDDQRPFREAATMVIELADGYTVAGEADSAEQALEMIAAEPPGLVLMDINLPGIDGLEATRRIVAGHPSVNVLVVSTYEAGEYESRARDAGAVGFVSKSDFGPWSLQTG